MINGIVTDLGGVLLTSPWPVIERFQRESGVDLDVMRRAMQTVTERDGINPLFELECGRMTQAQFDVDITAAISAEVGRDVDMSQFLEAIYAAMQVDQEMVDLMAELRASGYRMALLTNNVRERSEAWRAMLAVDDIFHIVVDSAFVGLRKPDPAIYEMTLTQLGLPAEQCLFVDDLEVNCTAATELGLTSVQFRETGQAIAEIRAQLLEPSRSQR